MLRSRYECFFAVVILLQQKRSVVRCDESDPALYFTDLHFRAVRGGDSVGNGAVQRRAVKDAENLPSVIASDSRFDS
ncbi:hypothetical protein Pla52o_53230 [Novipirellula galeiformis]|uniref:Uncharacterized protein n=1 Tax=Novipirellula galeiformis TaxID=2528004 RepID=A0A5C6C033_9BACT|nr:hypothetical protein Pla52o_53230 [Novipirellula galeiformis]